jgi:hypothetical protein
MDVVVTALGEERRKEVPRWPQCSVGKFELPLLWLDHGPFMLSPAQFIAGCGHLDSEMNVRSGLHRSDSEKGLCLSSHSSALSGTLSTGLGWLGLR